MSARWQDVAEKGTAAGMAFFVFLATFLGRRVASLFLAPVAFWYVCFSGAVRHHSREYLARVYNRPARFLDIYRHVRTFAQVTLDRLFLVRGELEPFEIVSEGEHNLVDRLERGQGTILLLSHLGSYEAMRAMPAAQRLALSWVGDFRNARLITRVLRQLNPAIDARLISIHDEATFVLQIAERIAVGEAVTTMADRVGIDGKSLAVEFLGAPARFPTGPYLLASALRCPVVLAFSVYRPPNRYCVWTEPFAERIELPRANRDEALRGYAQRYASRLEAAARTAPENWFNFYDYWSST